MKVIIDIPEKYIKTVQHRNPLSLSAITEVERAIAVGTPIPDNATNGQVIQTLFKPNRVERTDDDVIVENYDFSKDWWNAPYQKGGKKRDYDVECRNHSDMILNAQKGGKE